MKHIQDLYLNGLATKTCAKKWLRRTWIGQYSATFGVDIWWELFDWYRGRWEEL